MLTKMSIFLIVPLPRQPEKLWRTCVASPCLISEEERQIRWGSPPNKRVGSVGPSVEFLPGVSEFAGSEGGKKLELFSFYDAFEIPSGSREIKHCSF